MKIYRGHRTDRGVVVRVQEGASITFLRHHVRHSPTGFEWGYGGSGPADLARSILADHLGYLPPAALYQNFKANVIAHLPLDSWELLDQTVVEAIEDAQREANVKCIRCWDRAVVEDERHQLADCPACAETHPVGA